MAGKRRAAQDLLFEEEANRTRLKLVKEHRELLLFSKVCTKFLRPGFPALIADPNPIFAKRGYRTLVGHASVQLPQYDDFETAYSLMELQQCYHRKTRSAGRNHTNEMKHYLSKEEKSLLKAAGLILRNDLSLVAIARLSDLSPGQVKALEKRMRTKGTIFPVGTNQDPILMPQHMIYIQDLIDNQVENFWTVSEIGKNLLETFNSLRSVSLSTIKNSLKKYGYSYKKLSKYTAVRNNDRNKTKRKKAAQELIVALAERYTLIFVDETSVKLNSCLSYAWGKKGERISLPVGAARKSYTVAAAITDSRVLGCMIFEGGVKSIDYVGFLSTLIDEYGFQSGQRQIVVFHDNAPSHIAKFVQDKLGDQVTFIFNGPYTPMLNPIEEFFSKFKHILKREPCGNRDGLVPIVQRALQGFRQQDFQGYVSHALSYCSAALEGEDII